MTALSSADAKKKLLPICRAALKDGERVYVKDKAGVRYLTIDPEPRYLSGAPLDVTAQYFKENFARLSSLVKTGICFRLSLRNSRQCVFARRHTAYVDPCDDVVSRWKTQLVNDAFVRKQEARLLEAVRRVEGLGDNRSEEILDALRAVKLGIERMAIGHLPFREGQLPDES